jgi:hypothetical protein
MNFDLNIENYTRDELIQMFELPNNFDRNIVEIKETKLREGIINNNQLNKEKKDKTLNFLQKAKLIILKELKNIDPLNKFKNSLSNIYHTDYELKPIELQDDSEHMVQVRKEKPYVSSSPSEYFSGIIIVWYKINDLLITLK